MEIFFSDIPAEGLHLEGELSASIFGLAADDPIRPAGAVRYEIDAYAFEEVVAFSGRLRGPFQLQCGACLEYFDYEADFPSWCAELDREPGVASFDLETLVREEFLLLLPAHPRCDELVEGRVCPKADLLEDLAGPEDDGPEESPRPDVWGALDKWRQ
jgi:uncharacterized metal-binding protein YceD (DUF177 family)